MEPQSPRVTIRDIARKSGYHYSTVSLALKDDSRIPLATREKIQSVAQKAQYRPDPVLGALAVYRNALRPARYRATLAWLVNDAKTVFHSRYNFRESLAGAQERAGELGYKLEEHLLRKPGMTPEIMVRTLVSRGIDGILISPQPNARMRMRIRLDWSPFAAVSLGYTLAFPNFHRVAHHHFRASRLAVRKLYSSGYRRIGLCVHRVWNGRVDGAWVGGYFSEVTGGRHPHRIEPLLVDGWEKTRIQRWIRENRIDAVIFDNGEHIDLLSESRSFAIPGRLGAASLQVTKGECSHSGICQNQREVGRKAVDLLAHLLLTRNRGIPSIPQNLLVEGTWQDGMTTRRVVPKSTALD